MSMPRTNGRTMAAALFYALLFATVPARAQSVDKPGWKWIVAPYAWAVGFDTDLKRRESPAGGSSNDTSFSDVVNKLDGAFQMHIEGQTNHWGVFADFTYLGLADEKEFRRFRTESDLDARLFEVAGVWSPDNERYRGLDVFAGLRVIDVDMTVNFHPANPSFETTRSSAGKTFSDFMAGARYTWALSARWGLTLRGDASSGDTEGTWNVSAVTNLQMKHGAWLFGYRYMTVKLKTGDTDTKLTMSGPMVGYGFIF